MDVSPKQLVSIATALIPFLENDDTNRALMGSNMQRQAVPLLRPEAPMIATGVEHKIAYDSGVLIIAKNDGIVKYVDADKIVVARPDGEDDTYYTSKFVRSNQSTCINQKPIVVSGQKVTKGMILADGPSTQNGELALGRNILIGFMSWEGYNYEDAVLISEQLVRDDVFTSIHIEEYESEARETRLGEEQITRDIPNLSEEALKTWTKTVSSESARKSEAATFSSVKSPRRAKPNLRPKKDFFVQFSVIKQEKCAIRPSVCLTAKAVSLST